MQCFRALYSTVHFYIICLSEGKRIGPWILDNLMCTHYNLKPYGGLSGRSISALINSYCQGLRCTKGRRASFTFFFFLNRQWDIRSSVSAAGCVAEPSHLASPRICKDRSVPSKLPVQAEKAMPTPFVRFTDSFSICWCLASSLKNIVCLPGSGGTCL